MAEATRKAPKRRKIQHSFCVLSLDPRRSEGRWATSLRVAVQVLSPLIARRVANCRTNSRPGVAAEPSCRRVISLRFNRTCVV